MYMCGVCVCVRAHVCLHVCGHQCVWGVHVNVKT